MLRRVVTFLALVVGVSLLAVVTVGAEPEPPRAEASPLCSVLKRCGALSHATPDKGYDRAILVRCDFGDPSSNRLVKEGKQSPCADTDQMRVRDGELITCRKLTRGGKVKKFTKQRHWHKIYDNESWTCWNGLA